VHDLQAERVFTQLRSLEPQRIEGLDIYSTVLWHLQSEVALSALAQDVTECDRLSPQVLAHLSLSFSGISVQSFLVLASVLF